MKRIIFVELKTKGFPPTSFLFSLMLNIEMDVRKPKRIHQDNFFFSGDRIAYLYSELGQLRE